MTTHLPITTYYGHPTSMATSQGFDSFVAGEDESGNQQVANSSYSGELYYVVNAWLQYYGNINAWNIKYNPSTQVWTDNSINEEQPVYITDNTTSTPPGHATTDVTSANPQYVFCYGSTSSQLLCSFQNPYYSSGGGTSTEGSSYSATLEVNSNGWLEYTIPTTSSSGTYYLLKSSDGGVTWTQHGQSITHGVLETQGSFVFDQTLIWIIRSPTEDELARWTPPSTTKKVFCNFW